MGIRVVIIGAGIAGLAAARALANRGHNIIIIDRDRLDPDISARRCVPQGHHLHLLLTTGFRALNELFPHFTEALHSAGAHPFDVGRELRYFRLGSLKQTFDSDLHTFAVSRPTLEALVRDRVTSLTNVELRSQTSVTNLHTQDHKVLGVALDNGEQLECDLVIDASGRGTRIYKWMRELSWPLPRSTEVHMNLAYASRMVRLAPGTASSWRVLYEGPAPGTWNRGGAIMKVENNQAIVTLAGYGGEQAPIDDEGFIEYTAGFSSEFYQVLKKAESIDRIRTYKVPTMRRYHFESLRPLPVGLLCIGDSICQLDPAFGQGMSIALKQAQLLGTLVIDNPALLRLAHSFYPRAKTIIDRAWWPILIDNFRRPKTRGSKPLGLSLLQWYSGHVMDAAGHSAVVHRALQRTLHMTTGPEGLLHPTVVRHVLAQAFNNLRSGKALPSPTAP